MGSYIESTQGVPKRHGTMGVLDKYIRLQLQCLNGGGGDMTLRRRVSAVHRLLAAADDVLEAETVWRSSPNGSAITSDNAARTYRGSHQVSSPKRSGRSLTAISSSL